MSAMIRQALQDLDRHVGLLDLDRDGLADDLMDTAVEVIRRDMDAETDPDGSAWPPLSDDYEAWKSGVSPGDPMAVLHGVMKTDEQLRGESRVTATEAVMVFGTDEQARDEACWFQEGNDHQPARPFYAFSAEALTRFDEILERRLRGA